MIKTLQHLTRGIIDEGSRTSKDFKSFSRVFKNELAKELREINATDHTHNTGHYYVSGFFKFNDQFWYYSLGDVRYDSQPQLLIRTASSNKDYTGGHNNFIQIKPGMIKEFFRGGY